MPIENIPNLFSRDTFDDFVKVWKEQVATINKHDGYIVMLGVIIFKLLAFCFDTLTFYAYFLIQKPWIFQKLSKRMKAKIIQQDNKSITYESTMPYGHTHVEIIEAGIDTMAELLEYVAMKYPDKRCLGTRKVIAEEDELQPNGRVFKKYNLGEYMWQTYSEVNYLSKLFGSGLRSLGYKPTDRIVIFAETRAEWFIACQGVFKQNMILVTVYTTLSDDGVIFALNQVEATTVITSYDLMFRLQKLFGELPHIQKLIYMEDQLKKLNHADFDSRLQIISFSDFINIGKEFDARDRLPTPQDVAVIMYTSGSTGDPKGVLISHDNLMGTMAAYSDAATILKDDVCMSFLPLAHVFELLIEGACLICGISIGYSSALTLIDSSSKIKRGTQGDASLLRPTCMACVPLIMDRIKKALLDKVNEGSIIKKILFHFAYGYKASWIKRGYKTPLIDRIVFKKIRNILGGQVRVIMCGGAPLTRETQELMTVCFSLIIHQGYGLTETTAGATVEDRYDMNFDNVGPTNTTNYLKLINWEEGDYYITDRPHPRGEILIGGQTVTLGYFRLPEQTREDYYKDCCMTWFKTGDIGEILDDGVLRIIDRKKDLVKLQTGEYISLGKIEARLKTSSLIDNICLYADSRKIFCVGLIVPDQIKIVDLAVAAKLANKDLAELCVSPIIKNIFQKEIVNVAYNTRLNKFEIPGNFKLLPDLWTPDTNLVTSSFKLRRKEIYKKFEKDIEELYQEKS